MKKFLLATATSVLLTTACSASVPAQPTSDVPAGTNRPTVSETSASPTPSVAASPSPTTEPVPTTEPPSDGTAPFGSAYTWTDGLSVTIGEPAPYEPSEWAAKGEEESFVVFDVHVINNTGAPWDPALLYATIQSGNQEGTRVFDSGQLPPEPTTTLLDGREVQFQMAFGVADPSDLVLELAPDWEHESVLFHG